MKYLLLCLLLPTMAWAQHYRTAQDGLYSNPSIWEYSADGTHWIAASDAPQGLLSSVLIAHSVALDADISVSPVRIAGALSFENFDFVLLNGGGIDLLVEGTLFDHAPSSAGLAFESGATWQLGAEGRIVKTANASVASYRDAYEGGIAQIPATAHWVYRYTGGVTPTLLAIDMHYPNLVFENASSVPVFTPASNLGAFRGGSKHCVVKGNLDVGGNYANGYVVFNNNFSENPMEIWGNVHVRANSRLSNRKELPGTAASSKEGTGFRVHGHIQVDGTLELLKSDSARSDENTRARRFDLVGAAVQQLAGNGTLSLDFLRIDGQGVALARPLHIQRQLALQSGIAFGNGHTVSLAGELLRTEGLAVGTFTRLYKNAGKQLFPLGNSEGRARMLEIEIASGEMLWLSASFEEQAMGAAGFPIEAAAAGTPKNLLRGSSDGHWHIQSDSAPTSYSIEAITAGPHDMLDAQARALVIQIGDVWQAQGSAGIDQLVADSLRVGRAGLHAWGKIGLAGGSDLWLPLQSHSLQAQPLPGGQCALHWEADGNTATEIVVEGSKNGFTFEALGTEISTAERYLCEWRPYYRLSWQPTTG